MRIKRLVCSTSRKPSSRHSASYAAALRQSGAHRPQRPSDGHLLQTRRLYLVASPIASLSLSYKPTSHTAGTCSSGSETDYLGTLPGSVTLTTGLKGLKLSDTKATFSTPNSLQVDAACVPPIACSFSSWGGGLGL